MTTWRLKFTDRAEMLVALEAAGWIDSDGIKPIGPYRFDELGHLPDIPTTGDPEAGTVVPGTFQDGWFVNVLDMDDLGLPAELVPAVVTPSGDPYREFGT